MANTTDWQTKSSELMFESPWIKVFRDQVLAKNKELTYSFIETQKPSVLIVPINIRGEILIQNTFRYTLKQRVWEIPAGFVEPGEDLLVAAKRELLEETGLISEQWRDLGCLYQMIGLGKVPIQVFVAKNVTQKSTATDEDEDITDQKFATFDEIEKMIKINELFNAPVIAALYMAKLQLRSDD